MTIRDRSVAVKQLPELLDVKQGRLFFHEIRNCMNVDRPRMVLDCSNLRQLDRSALHLLLCCLEEAMKSDGDVRLAALPPGAESILEVSGAGRLFGIYETAAEAVNSFQYLPIGAVSQASSFARREKESESAA